LIILKKFLIILIRCLIYSNQLFTIYNVLLKFNKYFYRDNFPISFVTDNFIINIEYLHIKKNYFCFLDISSCFVSFKFIFINLYLY
jgi:hypothetical protein